ncbi:MAG: isoamylase early set domain-containing protein [Gemmatimonadaceae bacterium]
MSDHEHDTFVDEISSELKRPVRFSDGFDARVMAAIRTAHLSVVRGERAHEGRPGRKRVFVPAIAGLAAAAVLTFMIVRTVGESNAPERYAAAKLIPVADARGEESMAFQDVVLAIYLPAAQSVAVMGGFNDWDGARSPMKRQADGTWIVTLRLPPGSYEYQFLMDGAVRMTDPASPATDSEFGEANSVLTVAPRGIR